MAGQSLNGASNTWGSATGFWFVGAILVLGKQGGNPPFKVGNKLGHAEMAPGRYNPLWESFPKRNVPRIQVIYTPKGGPPRGHRQALPKSLFPLFFWAKENLGAHLGPWATPLRRFTGGLIFP